MHSLTACAAAMYSASHEDAATDLILDDDHETGDSNVVHIAAGAVGGLALLLLAIFVIGRCRKKQGGQLKQLKPRATEEAEAGVEMNAAPEETETLGEEARSV